MTDRTRRARCDAEIEHSARRVLTLQSSADLRCLACGEVPGVHAIGCPLDPTEGNAR